MNPADSRSIEILIVDDNQGDIRLMREALKESKLETTFMSAGTASKPWRFCTDRILISTRRLPICSCST